VESGESRKLVTSETALHVCMWDASTHADAKTRPGTGSCPGLHAHDFGGIHLID